MQAIADFLFQNGMLLLSLLMIGWAVAIQKKHELLKRVEFRAFPVIFAVIAFLHTFYEPIVITSPANHLIVHPGDKVPLTVEIHPAMLAAVYPITSLYVNECYTCTQWPTGLTITGGDEGPPYHFTVNIPKDLPATEIYVSAYSRASSADQHAAMRSPGIGLIVQWENKLNP